MKLSSRSYPHPVIGNRDDVPGAAFQATVDMSADRQNIYLDVRAACSSVYVNALLGDGTAALTVHVECSNTLFRRVFRFEGIERRIAISADELNDAVEVNTFVTAARSISSYRVPEMHPDYGDAMFDIRQGEILAVADGYVFDVESDFDSMARIGTIMQVTESSESGDRPFVVDYEGDKILVFLSKNDFSEYKLLRVHDTIAAPLTATIVLPSLAEALRMMPHVGEDDNRRWTRVLRRRLDALQISLESDPDILTVAQQALELPLRRALAGARQLAEGAA